MDQHAAFRRHIKELEDRVDYLERFIEVAKERFLMLDQASDDIGNTCLTFVDRCNEQLDNRYEWNPDHA